MSFFGWANKQFERLSEQLAPVPNDPGHRFSKALQNNDSHLALMMLSPNPPPMPDGTHAAPLDPYSTVISNRQKGTLAIHCAAQYANHDVIRALIGQYGIPVEQFDSQGNTPLHYAASSQSSAALSLVKTLVNELHASVTVKNSMGKTPYDVATQDCIRQYLLPIQLQKETQECIDNGGQGFPDGIDMGGMTINRHLPPPPIGGGMGSAPPMGNTGYNGQFAGGSASKYAAPTFGVDQSTPSAEYASPAPNASGAHSFANNSYAQAPVGYDAQQPTPNVHSPAVPQPVFPVAHNTPAASEPAVIAPYPAAQPFADGMANNAGEQKNVPHTTKPPAADSFPSMDGNSNPAVVSQPTTPAMFSPATNPSARSTVQKSVEQQPTTPAMFSPTANPSARSTVRKSVEQQPDASADSTPVVAATTNEAPKEEKAEVNSTPTPTAVPFQPPATQDVPTPTASTTTESAVKPLSNSTDPNISNANESMPNAPNSYARRGHSSAAIMPSNSKYKPDGFHSSSSDVSLQRKYGHDPRITGPPSGTYSSTSNVGPPPSAGSTSSVGINPYAGGGSVVPNAYSSYSGGAVGRASRYPTYDAVANTVGGATGGNSSYNPYSYNAAPAPAPAQYNVYNPNAGHEQTQYQYDYSQQQQYQQQGYDNQQQGTYDYSQQQGCNYGQEQHQQAYDYNQQQQSHYNYDQQHSSYDYSQQQQQGQSTYGQSHQQQQQNSSPDQTAQVQTNNIVDAESTVSQEQTSSPAPVADNTEPVATEPVTSDSGTFFESNATGTVPAQPEATAAPVVPESAPTSAQFFGSNPTISATSATGTTMEEIPTEPVHVSEPVGLETVGQQFQTLNVGAMNAPSNNTSTSLSASSLFGSPVPTSDTASNTKSSVAGFFGSAPAAAVATEPIPISDAPIDINATAAAEDDDVLPPPPFPNEEGPAMTMSGLDDDLPPPPIFGGDVDHTDTDASNDELPPPPMMDIALS